ncbi:MAG: phosphoribosylformylglycinamidine synthase I [Fidelibacterota bacterium]
MAEINIAVLQFPGSNTERETCMALLRCGMIPHEFFWNHKVESLAQFDGFVLTGGFSYEDRVRAGVLASLDPIMNQIKIESEKGKPVLGICNGAQILVESGLVPGLNGYQLGMALTDNKRTQAGHVMGVGYYNTWANIQCAIPPKNCAFTRDLKKGEWIKIPVAHGEGRFVLPPELLEILINNDQTVFRYCDDDGNIFPEFPTNPNGSTYNLAAVCNPAGNVMALMPHPERTPNGNVIFTSMRKYIQRRMPTKPAFLDYTPPEKPVVQYKRKQSSLEWLVKLIITDNTAISVNSTLDRLGIPAIVNRYIHWEIQIDRDDVEVLTNKLIESGALINTNKEYLTEFLPERETVVYLIRNTEDMIGRRKQELLTSTFGITGITSIKQGVLWNIKVNHPNFECVIKQVLETKILFNPFSQELYAYH